MGRYLQESIPLVFHLCLLAAGQEERTLDLALFSQDSKLENYFNVSSDDLTLQMLAVTFVVC